MHPSYFSRRTGGLASRRILCQYHSVAPAIQGAHAVFMPIHTLVKPPFWWMPWDSRGTSNSATHSTWRATRAHHHLDVLYLSHADVGGVVDRQPHVNQKVFVGHTSQFQQRHRVALVETALVLIRLQKGALLQATRQRKRTCLCAC